MRTEVERRYAEFVTRLCSRRHWSIAFFKSLDLGERDFWIEREVELDDLLTHLEERIRTDNDGNLEPSLAVQLILTRLGYA